MAVSLTIAIYLSEDICLVMTIWILNLGKGQFLRPRAMPTMKAIYGEGHRIVVGGMDIVRRSVYYSRASKHIMSPN
jgi:hypothetical protein